MREVAINNGNVHNAHSLLSQLMSGSARRQSTCSPPQMSFFFWLTGSICWSTAAKFPPMGIGGRRVYVPIAEYKVREANSVRCCRHAAPAYLVSLGGTWQRKQIRRRRYTRAQK